MSPVWRNNLVMCGRRTGVVKLLMRNRCGDHRGARRRGSHVRYNIHLTAGGNRAHGLHRPKPEVVGVRSSHGLFCSDLIADFLTRLVLKTAQKQHLVQLLGEHALSLFLKGLQTAQDRSCHAGRHTQGQHPESGPD